METLNKRIIVTGGGSGGHVSAASAIISELKNRYTLNDSNFLYIGGDLGLAGDKGSISIEKKLFKDADFKCEYIRAGKLQRQFSFQTIKLLLRTVLGFIDAYKIIKGYKPDIIISTGGFVTVPVCLVGKLFKSKIYLHEQTAAVGLSNEIVGKFAEKVFVTFPESIKYFQNNKAILTGNLVRNEIFSKTGKGSLLEPLNIMLAKQEYLPIIYVSGGGLGSHIINDAIKNAMQYLVQDFQLIIQTGDNNTTKDYEVLQKEREKLDIKLRERVYITKYVGNEEIGPLLNTIDLFVGRAGANTVYEMGVLQIPSIFIPIPWVTHNEQFKNATVLSDLGLAEILPEGELTHGQLILKIKNFSKKNLQPNYEKLKEIFTINASKKILDNINI